MSVYSVLGKVPVSSLGKTLTHEHFNLNFEKFYCSPPENLKEFFNNGIHLENVGFIKQYPYSSEDNLKFFGNQVDDAVVKDVSLFKKSGGGTIVENTSHGLDPRNLGLMVEVSKKTGVNVIAGTGYYVEGVQKPGIISLKIEELYNNMKAELLTGCIGNPEIRAGFIGEVGSSWPITDFEKRCIKATGEVQEELKCGVSFHPGRYSGAPAEILRIYSEAGGNMKKAVMSHLDRTLESATQLVEFSEIGSYCQFDLFGTECSLYQLNLGQDMLSDAQRIKWVSRLIDEDKLQQVLLSHDIHTRHRLTTFGGHGYNHIITNVVPKMVDYRNIHTSQIETILEKNPAAWLQNNL